MAVSDAQLAWLLADAAASCLNDDDRATAFVELGCGEHYLAIERILTAIIASRTILPVTVLPALTTWLHGYHTSPMEPRLRKLISAVRLQQFQVISGDAGSWNAGLSHGNGSSHSTGADRRRRRRHA